ncbi:glycosyltransferase [Streptomyces sp. NPDC006283]|uniref:glycosyltransferase n=1 Tax=Streptomyces sp. NPDC006283 TaxID=3156741 RepID=UPI0033A87249
MRITHVVTLVSDDGAYGGPVSVATGQLGELAARGHDVELLSLWKGKGPPPHAVDGVPLRAWTARTLVPGQGFLGLFHPGLLWLLWRRAGRADVLHLHAGRDLVSLAALVVAVVRRRPFLVQTHGMVQPRRTAVDRTFDRFYVPLLRRAAAALVLTDEEEAGLRRVLKGVHPITKATRRGPRLIRLNNGVHARTAGVERNTADVLFLARLQARKRPEAFIQMAALVHRKRPDVSFTVYGPDEGRLPEVRRLIADEGLGKVVTYAGALDHEAAVQRTAQATVYVLPSVEEPFPMSVLESLAVGTPVVCTDSCGIAGVLRQHGAALVTDGSPEQMAEAVLLLLEDAPVRKRVVRAGRAAVEAEFSLAAVADRLEQFYQPLTRV